MTAPRLPASVLQSLAAQLLVQGVRRSVLREAHEIGHEGGTRSAVRNQHGFPVRSLTATICEASGLDTYDFHVEIFYTSGRLHRPGARN